MWCRLVVLVVAAAACAAPAPAAPADPFAGHYEASGGGGALAQMQALTAAFSREHPSVKWTLNNVGSDGALPLLKAKQIDLAFISRDPSADERAAMAALSLGVTGTGLAVRASNPVANLTLDQVRAMYAGELTDWSAVGGTPGPIHVFTREAGAPTRTNFEEVVFGEHPPAYPKDIGIAASGNEMIDDIAAFAGSIGVVTIKDVRIVDPRVKILSLNGIAATKETVDTGAYPMRRPLWLLHPKDPAAMRPAIGAFVEFVRSPEGQQILGAF